MTIGPEWAYYRLGTEQAGNLFMWRDAVAAQTERVRVALADDESESWRVDFDAHFLIVAVRNGVRLTERLLKHVPDPKLTAALDAFPQQFPHAKDLRDILTHLDEYVVDKGRLQQPKHGTVVQPGSTSWRAEWQGDAVIVFGPFHLPLLEIGKAAHDLLVLAADVWHQGLVDNVDGLDQA